MNISKLSIRHGSFSASSGLTACARMCHCMALQRKYMHAVDVTCGPQLMEIKVFGSDQPRRLLLMQPG